MHRVHEQIIELRTGDEALARALLDRVSALQRRELVAILDRVCTQLSPRDDRIHRIDRLELELGPIDPDDFERGFRRAFEAALRRALARAIADIDADAERPSRDPLELIETFATTGALPWWADASRPDACVEAVTVLVRAPASAVAVRRLIAELGAKRPQALARLVQALDEPTRAALLDHLLPGAGDRLAQLIAHAARGARPPDAIARSQLWTAALVSAAVALAPRAATDPRERFVAELLERAPARAPTWTRAELARALDPAPELAPEPAVPTRAEPRESLGVLLDALVDAGADERASTSAALALLEGLERDATALHATTHAHLEPLERDATPATEALSSLDPAALRRALAWLDSPAAEALAPSRREALRSRLAAASRSQPSPEPADTREPAPERETSDPTPPQRPPRLLPPHDTIPVANAGLVILWPLLPHLLRRCELVVDDAFVDLRAQTQAIALLERCAVGEAQIAEHQVALDKILCGLAPDDVLAPLDPREPVPPAWLAEADRLLEAVILHATILGEMPIDSLRATFLRREGLLRVRDGAWLLQVEAQTQDIVLERFPWSFAWVKLPWMPEPICVEW